jgi:hypothetical protein
MLNNEYEDSWMESDVLIPMMMALTTAELIFVTCPSMFCTSRGTLRACTVQMNDVTTTMVASIIFGAMGGYEAMR